MERIMDKVIVLAACLAMQAALANVGAGVAAGNLLSAWDRAAALGTGEAAAGLAASSTASTSGLANLASSALVVGAALIAIIAAALAEALPERQRVLAPLAYSVFVLVAPVGYAFLPLALYDAARAVRQPGITRGAVAAPLVSLGYSVARGALALPAAFAAAALMGLSALVSLRTSRMLARRVILNRTRDDLTLRARTLLQRTHALEDELASVQHKAVHKPECVDARPAAFNCLTERELEIVRLVADGLENREIAATAFMSEGTVRNHISTILSKLQLKNRTQLAIEYWRAMSSLS